jgi:N-methylhydantoinase B
MTVNTQVDRAHCKPWGLDGGRDGAGNQVSVRLGGKWKEDFPNAKVLVAQLAAGDGYRMRAGGDGYGDPRKRPAMVVAEDVRQGYVSVKAASMGWWSMP